MLCESHTEMILNTESVTLSLKDYSKLMSSDGYKEKYRKDMIRWSEEIRYDFKDCSSNLFDNSIIRALSVAGNFNSQEMAP